MTKAKPKPELETLNDTATAVVADPAPVTLADDDSLVIHLMSIEEPRTPFIDPTVGRIVHYYENSSATAEAAIITQVYPGEGVNLTIFRRSYVAHSGGVVPFIDHLTKEGPCWRWPQEDGIPLPLVHTGDISTVFPGATGATVFGVHKDRLG